MCQDYGRIFTCVCRWQYLQHPFLRIAVNQPARRLPLALWQADNFCFSVFSSQTDFYSGFGQTVIGLTSQGQQTAITYQQVTICLRQIPKHYNEVMGKDNESVGENEYISYEEIVTNQPDVIFLQCTPETASIMLQTINSMPALRNIPCVKNKQVYCIPFYTIRSPGIRISDAIDIFKQAAAQKAFTASKTGL